MHELCIFPLSANQCAGKFGGNSCAITLKHVRQSGETFACSPEIDILRITRGSHKWEHLAADYNAMITELLEVFGSVCSLIQTLF